jgi:hypothetical protein
MRRRGRLVSGLLVLGAMALVLAVPARSSSLGGSSETITVQAGQTTTGTMQLVPGVTYHAIVTGTIRVQYSSPNAYELHDAFYCFETNWPSGESPGHCLGNTPTQEDVALDVHYGQGSATCAAAYSCDVGLGASKGQPLPYQSSHTYEQDFEVGQPGTLKVNATRACTGGCVSGSFSVQISASSCSRPASLARAAAACGRQLRFSFRVDGFPNGGPKKSLPRDLVSVRANTLDTKVIDTGGGEVGMGEVKMTTTYLEPSLRTFEHHITFNLDDLTATARISKGHKLVIVDAKVVASTDRHCPSGNTVKFLLSAARLGGSLHLLAASETEKPCLFSRRSEPASWYDLRSTPASDRHLKSAKIGNWEPLG